MYAVRPYDKGHPLRSLAFFVAVGALVTPTALAASQPPQFKNRAAVERFVAHKYGVRQAACLKTSSRSGMCILSDGSVVKFVCQTTAGDNCTLRRIP